MHPVIALLVFVPVLIIIMMALVLATELTPPVPLLVLFAIVAVCCAMTSLTAMQFMLGGELAFEPDGLVIKRLLSSETYPWRSIQSCKVMPATGTFGDDALAETNNRVGIGLFLHGTTRQRDHDLDADVIVTAGDKDEVQQLMRIVGKIEAGIKRAMSQNHGPAGARPANAAPRPRQQFQQRPNHQQAGHPPAGQQRPAKNAAGKGPRRPAAKVDPVAQFRNRAQRSS
jgi:hypothetical protein